MWRGIIFDTVRMSVSERSSPASKSRRRAASWHALYQLRGNHLQSPLPKISNPPIRLSAAKRLGFEARVRKRLGPNWHHGLNIHT
nr:hypothetical protein CFP56_36385 [Quercus suber]